MIENVESNQYNHDAAEVVERGKKHNKIFWLFTKLLVQILILINKGYWFN